MGISPQVVLIGSPTGGIGAASPPCRNQAHPIYVITVDSGTLAQHEQQLKGSSVVVLAHELGHVLQFLNDRTFVTALCSNTLQGGVRPFELMADFAAGYALYKTQRLAIDQGNTLFARVIASLSDYAFTNVQHHGTVTERMNAFGFGEAAALRGRPINMAALMRNSAIFLERLAGPSQTAMAAGGSYETWVQQSLDEIGQ
jgi:hypothetical protein